MPEILELVSPVDPYLNFTSRERRIAELLMEGRRPTDIARLLGKSRYVVKNTLNRMYEKSGIVDGCKKVKLALLLTGALDCALCPSLLNSDKF